MSDPYVSPIGVAVFPKLVGEPDTYDGKQFWKTNLRVTPEQAQAAQAIVDQAVANFRKQVEESPNSTPAERKALAFPVRSPVRPETDKEGKLTGQWTIMYKSNYTFKDKKTGQEVVRQVTFFDAKGNPCKPAAVWGGSELAVSFYPSVRANGSAGKIDVRLSIMAVQIIKLVGPTGSSNGNSYGFTAQEGYTAPAEAPQDTPADTGIDGPPATPATDGPGF